MKRWLRKGQAVVTDIVVAFVLFMLLMLIVLFILHYYMDKLKVDEEFNDLSFRAMRIADFLAFSPGIPDNWTSTSYTQVPGLVWQDRDVSYWKLLNFTSLSVAQVKGFFGIGSYDFSLQFGYTNGSSLAYFGDAFTQFKNLSATSRREVMYYNQSAYFDFTIWR
ncbi:MAG: hypothetical protein Q7R96_06520 [Nanoarchaeota archaeon]|nr:hypothetical protein [Nanoarchaeota archaeon]